MMQRQTIIQATSNGTAVYVRGTPKPSKPRLLFRRSLLKIKKEKKNPRKIKIKKRLLTNKTLQ